MNGKALTGIGTISTYYEEDSCMLRYDLWYDEAGEFVLDNETGEYMTIEDACNRLNMYHEVSKIILGKLKGDE